MGLILKQVVLIRYIILRGFNGTAEAEPTYRRSEFFVEPFTSGVTWIGHAKVGASTCAWRHVFRNLAYGTEKQSYDKMRRKSKQ